MQHSEITGKEAELCVKLPNGRIKCTACARLCEIPEGKTIHIMSLQFSSNLQKIVELRHIRQAFSTFLFQMVMIPLNR